MGAQIAQKKRGLKENQAGDPYRCRPAQERQHALPCHGLDKKKKATAQKNGGSIEKGAFRHEWNKIAGIW
jgi:hypothetical protein